MAPANPKKQLAESPLKKTMVEHVPLHTASPSAQPRSPIRKRTPGAITMQQKQAMIDNMQLEITERARRLRAQYNYMATTVRSRIEMRLNRVPMSMRNIKMGDLLQKFVDQEQQRAAKSTAIRKQTATWAASPPKQIQSAAHNLKPAPRTKKRMSDAISGDKENEVEHTETAKKRARAATTTDVFATEAPGYSFWYAVKHGGKGKGDASWRWRWTQDDDKLNHKFNVDQQHCYHQK
ncbi:hypothetical protein FVER14953_01250 [Fusarium verticillioides]|nr:hypothetical protein FVER14953_01250 [Fusarium verticillioides]